MSSARWATGGEWRLRPWPSSAGVGLLGHQLGFRPELDRIVARRARTDARAIPLSANAWRRPMSSCDHAVQHPASLAGIEGPVASPEASISKLYWGSWHRRLGELAVDVGPAATVLGEATPNAATNSDDLQRSFLFARAETIYGGSNQIQRNIIGERVLGLPPEPKGSLTAGPVGLRSPPSPADRGTRAPRRQVVIVTAAAGSGIGSATAGRCLEEGASVVLSTLTSGVWPRRPSIWRQRRECASWPGCL